MTMVHNKQHCPKSSEQGSIIVLALLVTLIILGVGLTVLWVSSSGTKITSNITRRQEAIYAAEAGLERARRFLDTYNLDWSFLTLSVANGGNGCGADAYDSATKGRILCDGPTPLRDVSVIAGSQISSDGGASQNFAGMSNISYTIYIRNDDAEAAANIPLGKDPQFDNDRRVILRIEGLGRDHLSYYALEAVMATPPQALPENYISQHGGNAQNTNSSKANIPLPP